MCNEKAYDDREVRERVDKCTEAFADLGKTLLTIADETGKLGATVKALEDATKIDGNKSKFIP